MQYDPRTKKLLINTKDLDQVYFLIMYTLKNMRDSAGLPLHKYERSGRLSSHDSAAISLLEIGEKLGIKFDVTPHNHNKLDLTEV